jgi:hypothetical protein
LKDRLFAFSASFFPSSLTYTPPLKKSRRHFKTFPDQALVYIRFNTVSGYFFSFRISILLVTIHLPFTMLGHQFAFSAAPIRKVKEVQFGILSPEEIVHVL